MSKRVRWAANVVETKQQQHACRTPPLRHYPKQKQKRFCSSDPKVEELHHFFKIHEPSRLHECEAIVARYRENSRVDFLMCDMKAHYGCCSRRCRLCASGAMDEDALLQVLAQCGPVGECGTFNESYTGDDLEALLVMCGGRDSLSSTFDGSGNEPETPFMHSHSLSRDSSLSSACSLSSAPSSPVLHSDALSQKHFSLDYSSSGCQGDAGSPPLLQFRRIDQPAVGSSSPVLEFRRRDVRMESDPFDDDDECPVQRRDGRAESEPFDECDFDDFDMH